jgi:uroporphyrin-III C-methyltransferase/precorrin-2 dehydrogenase/sirohydrochlorin ferrochelatase
VDLARSAVEGRSARAAATANAAAPAFRQNAAMANHDEARLFPAFLDLRGRRVLVVGAGAVAARKVDSLLRCAARVTIVAPSACPPIEKLVREGTVTRASREWIEEDLEGMELAFAATDDAAVNAAVARAARALGIAVNVADDAQGSSFLMGSIVDRGPVRIAISTSGASPALARKLRARVEGAVPEGYGRLAALAGRYRGESIGRLPDAAARQRFWDRVIEGPIAALVLEGREAEAANARGEGR